MVVSKIISRSRWKAMAKKMVRAPKLSPCQGVLSLQELNSQCAALLIHSLCVRAAVGVVDVQESHARQPSQNKYNSAAIVMIGGGERVR